MACSWGNRLLLILCCCSTLFLCHGAIAIKIGAILDTRSEAGREQKTALEVAAKLLNSSANYSFFLNVKPTGDDHLHAASIASELINVWGAEAIICAGTWPQVALVAEVGGRTRTPVFSSTAAATPPASVPRPYFIQMSHSSIITVHCLAHLIGSYNWRRVIVLYEDDNNYGVVSSSIVTPLSTALQDVGTLIEDTVVFPSLDSVTLPKALVGQELERVIKSRLSRVFVVLQSSPLLTFHLFEEARRLRLMEAGNAWVIADTGVDSILELDQDYSSSSNYISSNVQGVIGIKSVFDETTTSYQNFQEGFKLRKPSHHQEHRISALYGYDAMHAIALGMSESKKKKNVTLMDGILASKFEGLSGYVEFGNDGSRRLEKNSSAFRVINFVGKSYREMGFWSEGVGLCKQSDVSVDVLLPVYWPGGSIKAPGGWRKLSVGVPVYPDFDGRFIKVDYDGDVNGKIRSVKGFCMDAFRESSKKLRYDLDFEFHPFLGTYDDLIHQVPLKNFDIVVGDFTISASRVRLVDFTLPYTESSLGILVRTKPNGNAWIFLKPFSKEVLGLIALSFVYTTLIVWHLEKEQNPNFANTWRSQFGTALWLMFSTIFFPLKKVRNYYTKFILVIWLFVVLIITQTFTASLSSILTTEKLKPVLGITEIGVNSDYLIKYLENVLHLQAQRIQLISKIEDYHKAFQSGKINAALMETPYLRLFLSSYEDYTIYGETQKFGGFGFVFPKGSPLVVDFNEAILQLLEDGIMKDLEKRWFSVIISSCPTTENYKNTDGITIDNLWGLFLLTGGTTTLVFLFSIAHSIKAQCHRFVAIGYVSLIRIWDGCKRIWRSSSSVSNNLETMRDQVHALEAQEGSSVVARSVHGQANGHT